MTTRNVNWKFEPVLTDIIIARWLTQNEMAPTTLLAYNLLSCLEKDFVIEEIKKTKGETWYQYLTPLKRNQALRKRTSTFAKTSVSSSSKTSKKKGSTLKFDLDNLMEIQQKSFPLLEIPRLVIYLTEKVIQLGGKESEGIFRLSIRMEDKIRLVEEMKCNGFVNLSEEKDPNVPAVILKQFFAELPQPLFSNYEECLKVCSPEDFEKLVLSLPLVNKNVLIHISRFVQEMTEESVRNVTKMNLSNLCLVFSPGMLRNPSTDVEILMIKQPKEQSFLRELLKWTRDNLHHKENIFSSTEEREKFISSMEQPN